jgi:hypothetical protein
VDDQFEVTKEQVAEQYQEENFDEDKCNKGFLVPMNSIIYTYACV